MRKSQSEGSSPSMHNQPGSPDSGEPVFLAIGRLRRTHGLRGDLIMDVLTDFPERLAPGKMVYLGDKHREYTIRGIRPHTNSMLISFEGFNLPEEAAVLRNQYVFVQTSQSPELPEGEYYYHQLIGMMGKDEAGNELGLLDEIIETGANDVYVFKKSPTDEVLIPAVDVFIKKIDLEAKEIIVSPPEWS